MANGTGIDTVRENLRLQQVYNVMLRYGLEMLLDQGVLGDLRRRMQQWIYHPDKKLEALSTPVKVRLMLQELGPTYVKMGQIVSSRADVLPPDWEIEMNKLQSDVPPFPYEHVEEELISELGASPQELYAYFENEPFAAASTAQVHRATLPSGEDVVVKVQRPGIRTQVKADLGIMGNAARVMERRAEWARDADFVGVLKEFGDNIVAELDYGGEAYNARRISVNMAGIEGVHIPVVYSNYSTSRILTMDFVDGVKVSNVAAIAQAGLDRHALAETVIRSLTKQLLVDGFFHADPHPGNVLIGLETGLVYYIDMGMVGELDINQRINLIQLLMVVKQHDSRGLAQVMHSLSKPFKEVDDRNYYRKFDRQVGRYLEPDSGGSFSTAVSQALNLLMESGLRLDPELTLALKALMQLEAITSVLLPDSSVVEMAERHVRQVAIEEITTDRVTEIIRKEATNTAREVIQRMPSLQEATLKWLDQYEKGRFTVEMDTSDLTEELGRVRQLGGQAVIAIILTGMLIGSAIAIAVSTSETVGESLGTFFPRLAFISFIFAMIIASIAVIVLLWRYWRGDSEDRR